MLRSRGPLRSRRSRTTSPVRTLAPALVLVLVPILVPGLALLATAGDAGAPESAGGAERSVVAVGFTVADMDRSVDFLERVLDFRRESDVEVAGPAHERLCGLFGARQRVCTLRLGDERIELTQFLAPEGRPIPPDARSNDRSFQHVAIVTSDMDAAYARLRAHGVRHASSAPQRLPAWNRAAAGIEAFYFKDPDGHVLEILAFPPDKGHPRWHRAREGSAAPLFLGIDHTAIVVGSTEASLGFYRDALGMEVVGASENHGVEQEHLSNVFGARLRITTLRFPGAAWRGPAVELLEYLAPGDGRPYPADSRANDLWHWQTTIRDPSIPPLEMLRDGGAATLVSPGLIELPDDALGFGAAVLLRDPDGHAVRLARPVAEAEPRRRGTT